MKRVNIKGAMPIGDQVIEPVEIVVSGHFSESPTDEGVAANWRGFGDDAQRLFYALRVALPGGTFDQLLSLMLKEKASHFIVSYAKPKETQ